MATVPSLKSPYDGQAIAPWAKVSNISFDPDYFCHSNYIIVTITIQPDEALAKALEHLASEDWEKNVDGELAIDITCRVFAMTS